MPVIQTFSDLLPWPQWSFMNPTERASPLQGGGVAIYGSSSVHFITCTIRDNRATYVSRFPDS
eukprot:1500735-Prymnesium_polylepis.1